MDQQTVVTVSQLNNFIKRFIEAAPTLKNISVKGEISNLTMHKSGHIYCTLKDESALIKAVMFRTDAEGIKFIPENGQKVIATGRISVFERDGVYQLYIREMEQDGIGSLYIEFEKLKAKLDAEGLFDNAHKKKIPQVPFSIGIITAPTGAAIRDMINISRRRFPMCEIVLYPSLVQGKEAAAEIIKGIEFFNRTSRVEVMVIGRGGGSLEDLWSFNDEKLARAIFASDIPVISAVGHEVDFTISDFVADLRAPTPSAAMELALPDAVELRQKFINVNTRNAVSLKRKLDSERRIFEIIKNSYSLTSPERIFQDKRVYTAQLLDRITDIMAEDIKNKRVFSSQTAQIINSYNPLGVLKRGYSVAFDKNGNIIKNKGQINEGEAFSLKLSDGDIRAVRTEEA